MGSDPNLAGVSGLDNTDVFDGYTHALRYDSMNSEKISEIPKVNDIQREPLKKTIEIDPVQVNMTKNNSSKKYIENSDGMQKIESNRNNFTKDQNDELSFYFKLE